MARYSPNKSPAKASLLFNKALENKIKKYHLQQYQEMNNLHMGACDKTAKSENMKHWNRPLYIYEESFSDVFNKSGIAKNIIDFLEKRQKLTKSKLTVLEDGIGNGNFITTIKGLFRDNIETTGVSFSDAITAQGKIDHLYFGDAIKLVINKKQDLIVSVFGSIHYVSPKLKKELIKKYLSALKVGGIALIQEPNFEGYNNFNIEEELVRHLEKQGFIVHYGNYRNQSVATMLIQRIK